MNKLIVVSGGTKGIGKAVLSKFAEEGFDLVTCSRNEQELLHLSTELKNLNPAISVHTLKADVSVPQDRKAFQNFLVGLDREIDVLVNNAGRFIQGALYKEAPGALEEMIQTNLYSAYDLSRAIIPGMVKKSKGHIFNICSTASIIPYVNGGSYCISKFAMLGMSKVFREEMKPFNIKVTAILPGATKTASWDGVDLPEERFVKPEDIADTIWSVYQLSPNADVEEILIRPQLGDL